MGDTIRSDEYFYTYAEIEDYFKDYGFDDNTIAKYVRVVNNSKKFFRKYGKDYDTNDFIHIFEKSVDILEREGFSEDMQIEGARNLVLYFRDNSFSEMASLLTSTGFWEEAITKKFTILRQSHALVHARYKYLLETGYEKDKYVGTIMAESRFTKAHNITSTQLLTKYPFTDEVKEVQRYTRALPEEKLVDRYGITKKDLPILYPCDKKQLGLLKQIKAASDQDILNYSGLTREQLLSIPSLDYETLLALRRFKITSDIKIERLLGLKRELLLLSNKETMLDRAEVLEKNSRIIIKKR